MGKKDKKSKTAEQKARVAAKQSKKAAQKDKKVRAKGGDDSDGEDVDLESVLEEYAKQVADLCIVTLHNAADYKKSQQALFSKVTEVPCAPPSPRASATLIGSPSNNKELFLFGGEYFNGALAIFHNDLLVYHVEKDEWRRVTSPNSPLPRSGHAWCRGGNAGGIYLFGGEFSSPKQGTFYHYNDFWRLDPSSREWTRIESKGKGPPARSGHRMTYFKNYILLFGGFQDLSQQTKYLQDLWVYDTQNYVWYNPTLPPATQKPDARSSFSFHPHELGAVLYGGYSRIKSSAMAGKQTKGGTQGTRVILKPTLHQDTWFLRIKQPSSDSPGTTPPTIRWERRKKPANPPNPARAGATMAYHKGRGILFGGVHDVEESEEGIESEFFDTLYAWNIERNRFFQLTLRRPRAAPKKQGEDRGNARRDRGKADEAELLRNLAALETRGSIAADADTIMITDDLSEDLAISKPPKPVLMTMPHSRFNAQLAVQDDVLYIFGGTYEHGDREYTFDEMYAVDLVKLDGMQEIYRREVENWQGSDDEENEGSDDDEEDSEDENMEDLETPMAGVALQPSTTQELSPQILHAAEAIEPESEKPTHEEDTWPLPRPFESLRDFFSRTSTTWQELVLETLRNANDKSIKELRKISFEQAETRWWDSREEVMRLEDEQEEAGIGEVVSMAERVEGGNSGLGRRR